MSSRSRFSLLSAVCVFGVSVVCSIYLAAQSQRPDQPPSVAPIVAKAVRAGESLAARDLPAASEPRTPRSKNASADVEAHDLRTHLLPRRNRAIEAARAALGPTPSDAALQTAAPAPRMPAPSLTFEGLGRNENIAAGFPEFSPPDANGDVGPNDYVQQVNLLVRVYDKTGNPRAAPFKLSSLFKLANGGPGGQCAAGDQGDGIVLYDPLADRWLITEIAYADPSTPPYHECVALSKTSDPTGAYYVYDFVLAGPEFPSAPKLGVWPDGYYMSLEQYTDGQTFNGTGVYALNRAKMLVGDPTAAYIYFNLSHASRPEDIAGGLVADLDGLNPPPAGAPNIFAYFTNVGYGDPATGIRLFNFHADFVTPANSTFTERLESSYGAPILVAPFSIDTPPGLGNVPQPAPADTSSTALDAVPDRLMHRLQYRNFGGYETLVVTHTAGAPGSTTFGTYRAGVRYYELRSTGGGAYSVHEQATFAPGGEPGDNISRWMGSAAEDNQGNLAVGYSVSSGSAGGNVYPGMRYAGRLATDPANQLAQGENTLVSGTGVQTSTGNRWGDYSGLTVDPVDDCTFWQTSEYYTAAGQAASPAGWQTRIGTFKFAQCTAPGKGAAHFTATACSTANNVPNALITIDGRLYGATATDGSFNAALTPGSHSYSVSATNYAGASGNFNVTNGNTTNVPFCLQGQPFMTAGATTIASESCGVPNNAIDPGETVTISFCVANTGGFGGNTSNLVGTLQPTGGVTSPSAPQNYGVVAAGGAAVCRNFVFVATGTCGGALTASIQLQDGAANLGTVQYPFSLGKEGVALAENFDGVTVPNLPAGWSATNAQGPAPLWVTSDSGVPTPPADSGANAAMVDDPEVISDKRLDSPAFVYHSTPTTLTFRHTYLLEDQAGTTNAYDVGVLEIQINGGPFQDIITAGGSFVTGGYDHDTIDPGFQNPLLPSRPNWSGDSGGFVTTVVNLPPSAVGVPVKLRWRMGSDESNSADGWRIDSIRVSEGFHCTSCAGSPFTDTPVVAQSTEVKAIHIAELRARTDVQRARFGLAGYTWTDATLAGVVIKAVHITELRTALAQAYTQHGLPPPAYTDPSLTPGMTVKAVHITELRNAVLALEGS